MLKAIAVTTRPEGAGRTRASTLQDVVDVVRLVETGRLKPVVSQTTPLQQAMSAFSSLRDTPPVGRTVLTS